MPTKTVADMTPAQAKIDQLYDSEPATDGPIATALALLRAGASREMFARAIAAKPATLLSFVRDYPRHPLSVAIKQAEAESFASAEALLMQKNPERWLKGRSRRYEQLGGKGEWDDSKKQAPSTQVNIIATGLDISQVINAAAQSRVLSGGSDGGPRLESIATQRLEDSRPQGAGTPASPRVIDGATVSNGKPTTRSDSPRREATEERASSTPARPTRQNDSSSGGKSSTMEGTTPSRLGASSPFVETMAAIRDCVDRAAENVKAGRVRSERSDDGEIGGRAIDSGAARPREKSRGSAVAGNVEPSMSPDSDNRFVIPSQESHNRSLQYDADTPTHTGVRLEPPLKEVGATSSVRSTPTLNDRTPGASPTRSRQTEVCNPAGGSLRNAIPDDPYADIFGVVDEVTAEFEEPEVAEDWRGEENLGGGFQDGPECRRAERSDTQPGIEDADGAEEPDVEGTGSRFVDPATGRLRVPLAEDERHPIFDHPDVAPYPNLTEEQILAISLDERTVTQALKEEWIAKTLCPKCGKPGFRQLSRGRTFCATCDVASVGVGDFSTRANGIAEDPPTVREQYAAAGASLRHAKASGRKKAASQKATPKTKKASGRGSR